MARKSTDASAQAAARQAPAHLDLATLRTQVHAIHRRIACLRIAVDTEAQTVRLPERLDEVRA